ncbi:hypothetical protein BaRGS_00021828 [Batillaria attramentaria]|uniref:Uncharacterized protein n=1 Tax=Batillaria attramentaria TaxID=370345 RepID=A0ABD0KIH9_9CAEN
MESERVQFVEEKNMNDKLTRLFFISSTTQRPQSRRKMADTRVMSINSYSTNANFSTSPTTHLLDPSRTQSAGATGSCERRLVFTLPVNHHREDGHFG